MYFPPMLYLFRAGDLFLGYFVIKKGHCLEIDLLGNVMVRGPGDSVGMLRFGFSILLKWVPFLEGLYSVFLYG